MSFASRHYLNAQAHLNKTAARWFDRILPLHESDLDNEFRATHADLLRFKRGFGWWVWKPFLLRRTLRTLGPADVLMYCDSQLQFVNDPAPLFDLCHANGGVLLFHQRREGHINRTWTRRSCFKLMGCTERRYADGPQLNAALSVWEPTPLAFDFLDEWHRWNSQADVVADPVDLRKEDSTFRDHRHDQSIISLMALKRKLTTWPDPSQYGAGFEQPGRHYGTIVEFVRNIRRPYQVPCVAPEQ